MKLTPKLEVIFYRSASGDDPVAEWIRSLPKADRQTIGTDLMKIQIGWPIGMPLVRKLEPDLWEMRSNLRDGIGRVLFTIEGKKMIVLHGFIKKTQKTPQAELQTARRRLANRKKGGL